MSADSLSQWLVGSTTATISPCLPPVYLSMPQTTSSSSPTTTATAPTRNHINHASNYIEMDQSHTGGFHAKIKNPTAFNDWRNRTKPGKKSPTSSTSSSPSLYPLSSSNSAINIDDLPVEILLHICSFLEACDVWRLSELNRKWRAVTNDHVLWQHILLKEIPLWPTVTSDTIPGHHALHRMPKETYKRSSPLMGKHSRLLRELAPSTRHLSLGNMLFKTRRRIKIAIFGPGLEHIAHHLIEDMLWGAETPFFVVGMLPGMGGIGGGVSLSLGTNITYDTITLYQKSAAERRQADDRQSGELQENNGVLSPSAQRVCEMVDAFVFVVDAGRLADPTCGDLHHSRCLDELMQFMNPQYTPATTPLLVWNCSSSATGRKVSAMDTATMMRLAGQKRPWRVEDVCMENFPGPITRSMSWIVEKV